MKEFYVYIISNRLRTTLYIGVTNDLIRRVWEHRHDVVPGFTSRYRVHDLVFYETCRDIRSAIAREKQLKGWRRTKKDALIQAVNPQWLDLSREILDPQSVLRGLPRVFHRLSPLRSGSRLRCAPLGMTARVGGWGNE